MLENIVGRECEYDVDDDEKVNNKNIKLERVLSFTLVMMKKERKFGDEDFNRNGVITA